MLIMPGGATENIIKGAVILLTDVPGTRLYIAVLRLSDSRSARITAH